VKDQMQAVHWTNAQATVVISGSHSKGTPRENASASAGDTLGVGDDHLLISACWDQYPWEVRGYSELIDICKLTCLRKRDTV
jgi:hypothetical protein